MVLHHLMVGTWTPPGAIFTFEFDDEKLTLKLAKRTEIPEDEPISWMTFDHARKNIYGAAMKKWSSFSVKSPTEIVHDGSHDMQHDPLASSPSTNTRAIFVLASPYAPHLVYGNPFYKHASHGNVFSVSASSGALAGNVQNYPYAPHAGVHGMVITPPAPPPPPAARPAPSSSPLPPPPTTPKKLYLHSADMGANCLWTHALDPATGLVAGLVAVTPAPAPKDHPRWVAAHPSGRYLYVLMEAGNRLCEYVVDGGTDCATDGVGVVAVNPGTGRPVYTHHAYPLIPPSVPRVDAATGKGLYRSDVCAVSASGRWLFASARSNVHRGGELPGYVSVFALRPSGAVERQVLMQATTTSGGHSNAVSPCPWSDDWVALTDDDEGWIEIFRWDGEAELLVRVARCRVEEKGFGMNAIWYD